jgi:hypothetical protein
VQYDPLSEALRRDTPKITHMGYMQIPHLSA